MDFVTVKVKCRVYLGNEYPFRVTLTETADGERFPVCDVCDVSDNRPACHDCWKHVREVLKAEAVITSGMVIK